MLQVVGLLLVVEVLATGVSFALYFFLAQGSIFCWYAQVKFLHYILSDFFTHRVPRSLCVGGEEGGGEGAESGKVCVGPQRRPLFSLGTRGPGADAQG